MIYPKPEFPEAEVKQQIAWAKKALALSKRRTATRSYAAALGYLAEVFESLENADNEITEWECSLADWVKWEGDLS